MIRAYLAILLIASATAQTCPTLTAKPNFDINKFLGTWYEIQYSSSVVVEGACVKVRYALLPTGVIDVLLTQTPTSASQYSSLQGYGNQDPKVKAQITIAIPSRKTAAVYQIIDTDYTSFTVITRCEKNGSLSVWVLAKEQQPAQSVLQKAYAVLDNNKISRSSLKNIDQKNC